MFLYLCSDRLNEDAPFPDLLDQEWKVFQLNEHTANQSPLLMEETSGFFIQYSELPSSARTSLMYL